MPRPKRKLHVAATETITPPDTLTVGHYIVRVVKAAGNNLYDVEYASGATTLVEMPSRFRNTIWVKRGTYVVIDTNALAERDNKLGGEIVNIIRQERAWRKMSYWPSQFEAKRSYVGAQSDTEDESTVGKLPPDDSDGESVNS